MTSHLLETVRDIPLNDKQIPVNIENSGFPFDDRDFDRDRSHSTLRSQLDDIARRHPEFAEHLNIGGGGFPFRSHTLGRHQPRRGSDAEKPSGSQDAEFRRNPHNRPFSRFDHFDFPFGKYFDEDVPDFYEAGYRVPERHPQHAYGTQQRPTEEAQPQHQQSQPSSPQPTSSGNTEKPPQVPHAREGARKQNIQQSNTVDLGQKQEPVDENRGQRSMSAPPENRSTGQRFVSSINIPIQRPSAGGDMGAKTSTQAQEPQQQQQSNKPNERVIPIHVEGRDEPIIPKNATFTQTPPQPQPQGERIFGRNPSHFTQFVNRGEPHGVTPEEQYRQQQQQYQKQQQQNFQQQQQQNQSVPQEPQAETQPEPEAPLSSKPSQLDKIQIIQKDVSELMNQVEKFNGKPRDKEYMYLDEMLTRNLLKLDSIMSEGKDNIKQARKEAIKCIEGCIGILEAKANANIAKIQREQEKMEVVQSTDEKTQEEPQAQIVPSENATEASEFVPTESNIAEQPQAQIQSAALEVSGIPRTGSVAIVTPMEVTTTEELKKDVPASIQSETQTEEKKEVTSSETEQKSEEGGGDTKKEDEKATEKENINVQDKTEAESKEQAKNEEGTNKDGVKPETNTEIATEATSPNPTNDATSEDKKEKKKGKKKEKTDKK